jgi:phytoene dehydrogenase-like protein
MNRTSDANSQDIVVIGAGIAGLVAAITAAEAGSRVVLIDAHEPGGRARTTVREGFEYNVGPHALYLSGHLQPFLAARAMAPPGRVPATGSLNLLRDGRLWQLSLGAMGISRTKLLSPRSRARILSLLARVPRMKTERFVGTTWQTWLGNEPDDVAGVLRMFVRTATYGNAEARFDAAAALDQLKLALRGVRYVDHGWQTIVDSLLSRFVSLGGTVRTGCTVLAIGADGDVTVETTDGPLLAGAAVIAGLSPDAVERITGTTIVGRVEQGSPVHAASLDLALGRAHSGIVFGIDEPLYLSPHAPVAKLAPDGHGLVSLLRYAPDGEPPDAGDVQSVRGRLRALATMAGIADADILHERYQHRLVVANSFPAAGAGGLRGRPAVDVLGLPGVFVAGDWVGPDFQLVDAASASGESAARRAMAHVASTAHVGV